MTTRRWVGGLTLLVAAAIVATYWWTSGGDPPLDVTPTVIATSVPTATAEPTSRATRLVPLAEIDVPDGCLLFESGEFNSSVETRFTAGERVHMELQATQCGMRALLSIVVDGNHLLVEWTPSVAADLSTNASLFYDSERNRWIGATRFEEAGIWEAPLEIGLISSIVVEWASYKLDSMSQVDALHGEPQHIWIQDAAGLTERRWALTNGTTLGWLRNPDRIAFIQVRGGTSVLALGEAASEQAETVIEVGRFPSISAAPDGRALAVSWTNDDGFAESRLLAAAGWHTSLDLNEARSARFWWSPTSDLLLVLTESELLALSPGGGIRARHELDGTTAPYIEWSPDGSYALLVDWATGAGTRIDRFDAETLKLKRILDRDVVMVGADSIAIGPTGRLALTWWESPGAAAMLIAIVEPDEVSGLVLADHEVQRLSVEPGSQSSIGGFSWSPEGDQLAFTSVGVELPGGTPDAVSSLAVFDIESRDVRELVGSNGVFTTSSGSVTWSSDGIAVLARRMECDNCRSEGVRYEVVRAQDGLLLGSVERPTSFESWVSDLDALQIGGTATDPEEIGAEARQLAEELLLWGMIRSPSGTAYALVMPPGPGTHLYTSSGDVDELSLILQLDPAAEIAALLADRYVVAGHGDEWMRVALLDGSIERYAALDAIAEDVRFAASPSGELALAFNDAGFMVLDASEPQADALEAQRPWPAGLVMRRGGISWSPDESQIVIAGTTGVAVIDVRSGAASVYPLDDMGVGLDPTRESEQPLVASWGVDGTSVVFATSAALWQLDGQTGEARVIADAPQPGGFTVGTVLSPAPDGSAMAVGTAFGVFLPEPGGGWRQISRAGVGGSTGALYWSADASAVAYAGVTANGRPLGVVEASSAGDGDRMLLASGQAGQVLGWLGGGRIVFVLRTGVE